MARSVGLFPYADPSSFSFRDAIAYQYHKPDKLGDIVFHREQAEVYTTFASQVESLFRSPVIASLDEYGIPSQIGEKIQASLKTKDNLDTALAAIRGLDVDRLNLTKFEAELVRDAQKAM